MKEEKKPIGYISYVDEGELGRGAGDLKINRDRPGRHTATEVLLSKFPRTLARTIVTINAFLHCRC